MKRMVKNGDLLDISEDGSSATFGGNLKVGGTIIANGEVRGGDVSASKFLLGTEEMPLVKANPAGDATGTLEKIKIGDVAYKVGGGSSDREISLTMPYPSGSTESVKFSYIDKEIYDKINQLYYDTIKVYYNDGNPIGVFHVFRFHDTNASIMGTGFYACIAYQKNNYQSSKWYGKGIQYSFFATINLYHTDGQNDYRFKIERAPDDTKTLYIPVDLDQSKFDALYKLADKPTQDGTYVLKATVSGGAVTYTWVAQ